MKEKIENEIIKEIEKMLQKRTFASGAELREIIKDKVRNRNYLKEDWQIHYAVERIKEKITYSNLSSEQIKYISGLSWGAVFGGIFWTLGNKLFLWSLGYFVPLLNIYIWVRMITGGRKISWEKGNWKDFNQFKKRQKIILWILFIIFILYLSSILFSFIFVAFS